MALVVLCISLAEWRLVARCSRTSHWVCVARINMFAPSYLLEKVRHAAEVPRRLGLACAVRPSICDFGCGFVAALWVSPGRVQAGIARSCSCFKCGLSRLARLWIFDRRTFALSGSPLKRKWRRCSSFEPSVALEPNFVFCGGGFSSLDFKFQMCL